MSERFPENALSPRAFVRNCCGKGNNPAETSYCATSIGLLMDILYEKNINIEHVHLRTVICVVYVDSTL